MSLLVRKDIMFMQAILSSPTTIDKTGVSNPFLRREVVTRLNGAEAAVGTAIALLSFDAGVLFIQFQRFTKR
jgi:hypothetical protein